MKVLLLIALIQLTQSFFSSRTTQRDNILNQAKRNFNAPIDKPKTDVIVLNENGSLYTLELPRAAGISWGSDLSFRWIYVQDLEADGEAAKTGMIQKGDYIVSFGNTSTVNQDFDFVLNVRL